LDRKWTNIIIWPRDRASISVQQLRINFIQHCFCDLGSHFEALESVLLIFFLGFASKKYDQTDSRAPKCLPRVTKTVMYIVNTFEFWIYYCWCGSLLRQTSGPSPPPYFFCRHTKLALHWHLLAYFFLFFFKCFLIKTRSEADQ
jgi:hypothetical protein